MTCNEASRLIGPFVDDELDVRSAVDVEGHLARCAACAQEKSEINSSLSEAGTSETRRYRSPSCVQVAIRYPRREKSRRGSSVEAGATKRFSTCCRLRYTSAAAG